MNVSAMPSGRDLDVLVAEKVMGFRVDRANGTYAVHVGRVPVSPAGETVWEHVKPYSTSDEAAFEIVRKMAFLSGARWEAGIREETPLGICRAALAARQG